MSDPHTECRRCLELEAELSDLRLFQAAVQQALRDVQMPPEGPDDTAVRENMERKSGSFEGPDKLDPINDPHNRDGRT